MCFGRNPMTAFGPSSKIGFVGAGKVGGSIAVALSRAGFTVVAVASRTFASAREFAERVPGCVACERPQEVADRVDVVFITSGDDAIGPVVSGIDWRPGQGVVHCSGAASLDVFEKAVGQGAVAGAFHPLQAVSSVENGVDSIPGITFGIEADGEMREYLAETALAVGGNPIFLRPEDKAMYHLTGVLMGNLLTTLGAVAAQMWETFGFTRAEGVKALAPMMRQVSVNLERSGVPDAVAGPYPRGDIGTVRKHLEALRSHAPEYLPLYCELALAGLPFAVERGPIDEDGAGDIRELIQQYRTGGTGRPQGADPTGA